MIRHAVSEDIPYLVEMGGRFYNDAGLKENGFDFRPEDLASFMKNLVSNEMLALFVSHDGNLLTGSIGGIVSPWFMDFRQRILTEQWWWVDPEHRGGDQAALLLDRFILWGKDKGASILTMVSIGSANEKAVKRYYRMKGFKYLESHFIKGI